jgi:imidazolonepropionase-like amidohydrolase
VSISQEELTAGVETAHDFGKRVAVHARAAESVKRSIRAGADCIYHCDFADEEALDMLEAVKDKVIVGPAFGLVHNSVFEGDVVGMTKAVVEKMGLARKLEFTVATYKCASAACAWWSAAIMASPSRQWARTPATSAIS